LATANSADCSNSLMSGRQTYEACATSATFVIGKIMIAIGRPLTACSATGKRNPKLKQPAKRNVHKRAPGVAGGGLLRCNSSRRPRGCFFQTRLPCQPLPKNQKPELRMVDPGGRPPGPEPGFEGFEFLKQRQGKYVSCFQRLTEPLSAQIQRN
jgi:hypothetical protein